MRNAVLLVALALLQVPILVDSRAAWAEEPFKPAAQKRLDAGMKLYKERKYDEAIKQLREGYAMQGSPVFLYAMGQVERMRGNCREAIIYYQAFLDAHPLPSQAKAAQLFIDDCRKQVDTGTATAAPPAAPVAPAAPPASAPAAPAVNPGAPAASSGAAPGPAAATAPSAAPEAGAPAAVAPAPVDVPDVPAPGGPPADAPPVAVAKPADDAPSGSAAAPLGSPPAGRDLPSASRDVLGAVLVGVGAAALVGGATLFALGRSRADDASNSLDGFYTAQGWGYAQPTGIAMLGVGAALIAGGVVRYVMVGRRGPSVSLAVTPSGGMIGVGGSLP